MAQDRKTTVCSLQDALLAFLGPEVLRLVFNFLSEAGLGMTRQTGRCKAARSSSFRVPAEPSGRLRLVCLSMLNRTNMMI